VVFRERLIVLTDLETPVLAPVTIGSRPTVENITSDAPDVVSVNAGGNVVAHRAGVARIRAAGTGSTIEVQVVAPRTLRIEPSEVLLVEGGTWRVRVIGDGATLPLEAVRWTTSAAEIAFWREEGVTAGETSGEATLTATVGRVSARARVRVSPRPAVAFVIRPDRASLHRGEVLSYQAMTRRGPLDAEWSTTDDRVLAQLQDNLFTAINPGKATLCARAAKRSTCMEVSVVP
jgi:hypothetical protein